MENSCPAFKKVRTDCFDIKETAYIFTGAYVLKGL